MVLGFETCLETSPAYADWGIDTDEDEEGSAEEGIEDLFGVDICRYPAVAPLFSHKVEEGFGGREVVFRFAGSFRPIRALRYLSIFTYFETLSILCTIGNFRSKVLS